jgi:Pectate lyase superfamily protein
VRDLPRPRISQVLLLTLLILCGVSLPALATIRNVQTCGATGNGSTDDAAAINTCIAQLVAGDTLLFPAGTYKVGSPLNKISLNNIEINGSSSTATIVSVGSGFTFQVGGNPGRSSGTPLTATANELSTTLQANWSAIGASAGSYILIEQGPTGASGQRGEIVQIQNISGNTATLATPIHDTFSTSTANEVATVFLVNTMVSGLNMHDIIINGSHSAGNAINITNVVNSNFTNITVENVVGCTGPNFAGAVTPYFTYGVTFTNITMTGIGSGGSGSFCTEFNSEYAGNLTVNRMSLTNGNGGTPDGTFGFSTAEGAAGTFSNITVDASGNGVGRPFKMEDCRYCTFNNITIQNQPSVAIGDNGITLEYFTAHSVFNNCNVTGIAGDTSFAINLYGDDNGQNEGNVSYNTFNNCTANVSSPGTYTFGVGTNDINNAIVGGTFTGVAGNYVIYTMTSTNNFSVSGAMIAGPAQYGIVINGEDACINNNTFSTSLAGGINVADSTSMGLGNTLNNKSSNLASGTCGTSTAQGGVPPSPPTPPSGLVAIVQ